MCDTVETELKNEQRQRVYDSQSSQYENDWKRFPGILVEVINLIRFILHKPRIQSVLADPLGYDLALAYSFERQKDWKDALRIYREILLNREIPQSRISNVLLHQGYCQAIISDYTGARASFSSIINNYSQEETAITALKSPGFW